MKTTDLQHSWDLDYQEAVDLQTKLQNKVKISSLPLEDVQYLAAADVSFSNNKPVLFAAVLLFTFPSLQVIEIQKSEQVTAFPYIPGLLSFREAPVLLPLFTQLDIKPDVILVDGQGIAHPRKFGLASHLGLLLEIPTIGCAKKKLFGHFQSIPKIKGEWNSLNHENMEIGRVLCTRTNVKPLFISVGHLMDLDSAIKIVLKNVSRYRIPDPIRQAHFYVNQMRKKQQLTPEMVLNDE